MKPRPKFAVGEEVRLFSELYPNATVERTEILAMEYTLLVGMAGATWAYKTADIGDLDELVREAYLHKLPPEQRTSWEDCIFQPTEEVVT